MDDREMVAAIRSENPAGLAAAYDKYAAALYDYCHWRLRQPADAAEAVRDTFVIAAAPEDLPEASGLRPWL
jgi:DNA-directed RNA polymerase specialized sigma24 family protein